MKIEKIMSDSDADEIVLMSATQLLAHYREKSLSPVEVTTATLERIDTYQDVFNPFRIIDADHALQLARASEQRWMSGTPNGLIDGVPTTIKDMSLTVGWNTLKGSQTVEPNQPCDEDNPVVTNLRRNGAVLLGKTNLPEFGWKGVTDSPLTGISRNPWDATKTCGGSSGGAAIAAAAGMGALHQGGDGAGSIRMPAAFCGVFGLKPTFGRVPRYPHGGGVLSVITHLGPMTRTVTDAALMFNVLTQPDARDWLAIPYDGRDYLDGLKTGVRGLRIAYSADFGYVSVDPEVAANSADAVKVFEDLGATVEHVDPPFENPRHAFETIYSTQFAQLLRGLSDKALSVVDPGLRVLAEQGQQHTIDDIYDAWKVRDALGVAMSVFHDTYDLLISPQMPLAAFDAGVDFPAGPDMRSWFDWSPFTYPFNFTQQPASSVPSGFTASGLPLALQIVGQRGADALVLQASRAFESARPFEMPSADFMSRQP